MTLRKIEPIVTDGIKTTAPSTGEPIFERVDPHTLFVDPAYQRDISDRGMRQIKKIVAGWNWTKFKPPIATYSEHDGQTVLKVLDGQHTAIAAASHPDVHQIPVMIVDAKETEAQAAAFVGQNTDRLGVTPLQLHRAAVVAKDEDALTMQQVCARAGITILGNPPSRGAYKARDTVALVAVGSVISRNGAAKARVILETLANADLAPVTANHIRAAELLITDAEYRDGFDPADLTTIAIVAGGEAFEREARVFSIAHKVPIWRAMAVLWFKKTKKRRTAPPGKPPANLPLERVSAVSTASFPIRSMHTPPAQRRVTSALMGDPEPGRSALGQRGQS